MVHNVPGRDLLTGTRNKTEDTLLCLFQIPLTAQLRSLSQILVQRNGVGIKGADEKQEHNHQLIGAQTLFSFSPSNDPGPVAVAERKTAPSPLALCHRVASLLCRLCSFIVDRRSSPLLHGGRQA